MNLFEVLAIGLIIAGLVIGLLSDLGLGWGAAMLGALKGAAVGFGIYFLTCMSILAMLALGLRYRPPFPVCKQGCCSAADYTYLSLDTHTQPHPDLPQLQGGMLARCACGTLYLRRDAERRVYEVAADGAIIPYMHYRPFGRWQQEHRGPGPGSASER